MEVPDHCQFSVFSAAPPTALLTDGGHSSGVSPPALFVCVSPQILLPEVRVSWVTPRSGTYQPPPAFPAGPSRAPPSA